VFVFFFFFVFSKDRQDMVHLQLGNWVCVQDRGIGREGIMN